MDSWIEGVFRSLSGAEVPRKVAPRSITVTERGLDYQMHGLIRQRMDILRVGQHKGEFIART